MTRWFRCLALALTLGLTTSHAFAQKPAEEPADPNGASGRPGDGYIATAVLAGIILFAVGKSARR